MVHPPTEIQLSPMDRHTEDNLECTTYYCVYTWYSAQAESAVSGGGASSPILSAAAASDDPSSTQPPSTPQTPPFGGMSSSHSRFNRDVSVYVTDMDPDTEERLKLRKTISQMMEKNLILDSGSVGFLRNLMPSGGGSGAGTAPHSSSIPSPSSGISSITSSKLHLSTGTFFAATVAGPAPVSSSTVQPTFIVCLISLQDNDDTFSLFRSDLDRYMKDIAVFLQNSSPSFPAPAQLGAKLSRWHADTFKYVTSAVISLRIDALAILLHACLSGKTIFITRSVSSPSICRFIDIVNLGFAPVQLQIVDSNLSSSSQSPDELHISSFTEHNLETISVSSTETNSFCHTWAEHLVRLAYTGDFVNIRHHLESIKLQIHQEVLTLIKTLESGSIDNYALFDSFAKIKDHPNRDLLMILLLQQTTTKELKESLECIYECMTQVK